jgi:hypothetical protein
LCNFEASGSVFVRRTDRQREEILKLFRTITFLKAALLAAITAPIFLQPAYGQQEVNPSWYNPWPDAPKPAVKAPNKIAEHKDAKATHKDHVSATQAKKKQAPAQEPLRTADALPPVRK